MSHILLRSTAFVRDSKRMLRKWPNLTGNLLRTLQLLAADPYHPTLKTHKLRGKLRASWACSSGYDLRVLFSFTRHKGRPAILLESVGTHDAVY